MSPVARVLPPAWWQGQGGAWEITFDGVSRELALATAGLGLGLERRAGRVVVRGSERQLHGLASELKRRGSADSRALSAVLAPPTTWTLRTRDLDLSRVALMGILNLTVDSFSGDGVGADVSGALRRAEALRRAGADVIDVGAESARADRPVLEAGPEAALVASVVAALVAEGHVVSADTYKEPVAAAALEAGAEIINDISGLRAGNGAARAAAEAGAGYVLNYSYSPPKVRPGSPPVYRDVVAHELRWGRSRLGQLERLGMPPERVVFDPGVAFGKSHDEDWQVIRRLAEFRALGRPILLAHSRKNFIGSVVPLPPAERDLETHVVSALAVAQGARLLRVHDAEGARRACVIAEAVIAAAAGDWAPGPGTWPWAAAADPGAAHAASAAPDKAAPPGQRW